MDKIEFAKTLFRKLESMDTSHQQIMRVVEIEQRMAETRRQLCRN